MTLNRAEVDTLLKSIDDMERRLRELERSNRTFGGVPLGQTLTVFDPNDQNEIINIGQISSGAATGLEIGDGPTGVSSDTWISASDAGLGLPHFSHGTYKADDNYTVASGTYTAGYRYWVTWLSWPSVVFPNCVVQTAVGTTAEFRIYCANTTDATSAVAVGSGATVNQTFRWDVSAFATVGTGPWVFELQARRTGGAGNTFIYAPPPCSVGNAPFCTPTGL